MRAGKSDLKRAMERIHELFRQAEEAFFDPDRGPGYSDSYVKLARKIAMKYQLRLPSALKRRFCKHCYAYLVPSENCRVRTHEGHVVYYCYKCKNYMRFPYKKEQKAKKD